MRIIDKLIPFLSITMTTAVMAQLPFFLQRFKPKQGLLGSGSSSYPSLSMYNPLSSASILSPTYSIASLLGAASNSFGSSLPFASQSGSLPYGTSNFGSSNFGTSNFGSSNFGTSNFGSSNIGSPSFGSLGLGSSPLPSTSYGSSFLPQNFGSSALTQQSFGSGSSFSPSSLGSPSFAASNFGSSSFAPSSGTSSFTSSGMGSPLFSSASFSPQGSGYSPFASATFNSPSILGSPSVGQKFESSNFGSSPLSDFSHSGNFDGLGGFDPIDLIEDYPGFSNTGFGKDLNFAGSDTVKFHAPSTLSNEYDSYLKRSARKK